MEGDDCGPVSSTVTLCLKGLSKIIISDTTPDIRNMNWDNTNMTQGRHLLDRTFRSATSNAYTLTVCYYIECSELPPCLSPLFRTIISHALYTSHDTTHVTNWRQWPSQQILQLRQWCTNLVGTMLRTVAPNIYGSSGTTCFLSPNWRLEF